MRRSLLAAAAGAVVALTAAPGARAQVPVPPPTATINITSPKPDGTQIFGGPGTTSGTVHADGAGGVSIVWVKAALVWAKPGAKPGDAPPVPKPRSICGVAPDTDPNPPPPTCQGTGTPDVAFTNAPLPAPGFNGPYQLVVTAHIQDGFNQSVDVTNGNVKVGVAVPPGVPGNPKASVAKDRKVTLGWDRNGEPDLYGYAIYRMEPGQTTPPPNVTHGVLQPDAKSGNRVSYDEIPPSPGGQYTYLIKAIRPGATGDVFSSSTGSDPATVKVTVPAGPPSPTTTTTPGKPTGPFGGAPVVKGTGSNGPRLSSSGIASPSTTEAVAPDPGFVRGLPYGASTIPGEEQGDDASVAINQENGGKAKSNQRGLLIPAATGAILFVAAFQLRYLKKRLEEPVTPLT